MRAVIPKASNLVGKTAAEIDFRRTYRAAVIAVQKGGRNVAISSVVFGPGDFVVLQVNEDSPLLKVPPPDFYKRSTENKDATSLSRQGSMASFVNMFTKTISARSTDNLEPMKRPHGSEVDEELAVDTKVNGELEARNNESDDENFFIASGDSSDDDDNILDNESIIADAVSSINEIESVEAAWKDLQVLFSNEDKAKGEGGGTREFLTAMQVAPKSKLSKRTATEIGLDKLPGAFLVSIDRPTSNSEHEKKPKVTVITANPGNRASPGPALDDQSEVNSRPTVDQIFTAILTDTPLQDGDVLWFAGSASAVGDLRKIPGLLSYENDEVEKINEKVHDRRLVEAVIARRGPLAGKTVKQARFRTRFGAAVIAVHRDGKRIHDHPGKIRLQAGDVLLLEAGPTFIRGKVDNDRSFALLAEVQDSAPPRLRLLIPALLITVAMLAVYTAKVAPLLVCALVASMLMVCLGILTEQEARNAVNWEVYITIAAAFGIGTALVNSGVAAGVSHFLVHIGEKVGIGGKSPNQRLSGDI